MARFIELHDAGDDDRRILVNIDTIAFITDEEEGACLHFCCSNVSSGSSMYCRMVKETYSQIKTKFDE